MGSQFANQIGNLCGGGGEGGGGTVIIYLMCVGFLFSLKVYLIIEVWLLSRIEETKVSIFFPGICYLLVWVVMLWTPVDTS